VTPPAGLESQLSEGETVLWDGKPDAPRRLSAYKGWHNLVARFFFAISTIMTLIFFTNRTEMGSFGLTWGLLGFVGGPILAGLAFRAAFSWLARDAMRRLHYAVTDKRILIQTKTKLMSFTIDDKMPVEIIKGRKIHDVVRFTQAGHFKYVDETDIDRAVYTLPESMILPRDEAAKAYAAIQSVKAQK